MSGGKVEFRKVHRRERRTRSYAEYLYNFKTKKMTLERLNEIGGIILDACLTIHKELGPGLLESAYVLALVRELQLRGLHVVVRQPIQLEYKGIQLGKVYFMDLLVEGEIILEIKSVEKLDPIFTSQLITYLKLADKKLGYLINFNVPLMKDGFKRIVNNFKYC